MKKAVNLLLGIAGLGLCAGPAAADEWLQGTYLNQDPDSLMDEVVFCEDGKAYAGMAHRTYSVETREGTDYVVLESNGTFTFSLDANGAELTPADDFTRDWFTKTGLKKDPGRTDTCNW